MMNVFAVVHQQIWKPCGTLSVHDYYSDDNATFPPHASGLSSLHYLVTMGNFWTIPRNDQFFLKMFQIHVSIW